MKALDLFCGAGGISMGLHRAGFDVTGIDIKPQPRYPFRFIQGDALEADLSGYDLVCASPPCQAYTQMSARWRGRGGKADSHPDLIGPVRENLITWGGPYIIENVVGARKKMVNPMTLTGGTFGLLVHRPRLFESNVFLMAPPQRGPIPGFVGVYGEKPDGRRLWTRKNGSGGKRSIFRCAKSVEQAREAMGIDWMEWSEIKEAIPPAYSEFLGRQVMAILQRAVTLK